MARFILDIKWTFLLKIRTWCTNFSSDDYAVYNLSGGTGTSGSTVDGVEQSNKPKGYIASGQGFFCRGSSYRECHL
jgi:hypothetical protein